MSIQILKVCFLFSQRIGLFSKASDTIEYLVQTKDIDNRVNNNHVS